MNTMYVVRGKLQEFYAERSKIINKLLQFILALVTFAVINHNVGYMKVAATPVVTLALAIVCTCLPMLVTVVMATILILIHMYAASLGILAVTAVLFLVMFIFYLRLTPKMSLLVLLTPLAFALKVPCVIPIAAGLIAAPISLIAVFCGTIVFYMMQYVKAIAGSTEGSGSSALLAQTSAYVKQVFMNKELWVMLFAFTICFFLVYAIHRMAVDHAWKIAIVSGAVANVIVVAAGSIVMGVKTSYLSLILGCALAVLVGLVLEFFFFSVDYARSESLQFEDDEYYYYVKAVPKLTISTPDKVVKHISERNTEEILLEKSLKEELEIEDIINKELER